MAFILNVSMAIAISLTTFTALADCPNPLPAEMTRNQINACLLEISSLRGDVTAARKAIESLVDETKQLRAIGAAGGDFQKIESDLNGKIAEARAENMRLAPRI
jgi:hypothetical protein